MDDKTIITVVGYLCGTTVIMYSLYLGHNGTIVSIAVAALWGLREVAGRFLSVKRSIS